MEFHVLASGSKGNCTVVCSHGHFLIVDCGTTKKYLSDCFSQLHLDYLQADGVLITHDHSDHIKQVEMFKDVAIYSPCEIRSIRNEHHVEPYVQFNVGVFNVYPLALSHDSGDTVGYLINDGQQSLAIVTDTGYMTTMNMQIIRDADYYIFESNHDVSMLMHSSRPEYLKYRILSDTGHMDNEYSANVLSKVVGPKTREIILAHLSQECNKPQIALETLRETFENYNIDVSRYKVYAAQQYGMYNGGSEE